jgi:hypothetical protein
MPPMRCEPKNDERGRDETDRARGACQILPRRHGGRLQDSGEAGHAPISYTGLLNTRFTGCAAGRVPSKTPVWADQGWRNPGARTRARILSIAATLSMRSSRRQIVSSPKCGPGSNIQSGSSSECSVSPRCALRGLKENVHRMLVSCAGQPVLGSPASAALAEGVVCLRPGCKPRIHPNAPPKRRIIPRYHCRPRKSPRSSFKPHPLSQTFPS